MKQILPDNGDRRLGIERRQFYYTVHIPERRSSIDRRNGIDRRGIQRKYTNYIIEKKEDQEQAI